MRRVLGFFLFLGLSGSGCAHFTGWGRPDSYSPGLQKALEKAGANRSQIRAVLDHYRSADDPLKLHAAEYLIENMDGKCFVRYSLIDSSGAKIDFEVLDYPDYDSMVEVLESIEAERGELDFEPVERIYDLETVEADFLIENIELAFEAWRQFPWARSLSFDDFCAYVLPYRGSNEPLERWRRHFARLSTELTPRMDDPESPVEAARLINAELMGWFKFDPRYYCHPTDQGLSDMLDHKIGRCEDMTNLAIYAMRANGLAVTSDYTPYWADTGNNHAWNAILDRDGRVVMFMGCEAHPGEYRLHHKMAKVYRKTYAEEPGNLAFRKPEGEEVPRWLAGKSYEDVTADYVVVSDVTVSLRVPPPDSVHFAYVCVFNSGEWQPIHWGPIVGRTATFTDLGREIAYLPAYYTREGLEPAGPAFLLQEEGGVRPLVAHPETPGTVHLLSTTRRTTEKSTDGVERVFLESGRKYDLFYWKDRWIPAGRSTAGPDPLVFAGVPTGGLYWLVADDSRKEERIFTYENGEQIWW